ncbi:hypothetical protein VQ209_004839 [Salmonella enterica]|nr:hypothetical protein [Salmonella enterica]EMD3032167.1 hypothetical protein [Salmonella enterica]EMD4144433.1 hypothetical protein [Salmonella enterica]
MTTINKERIELFIKNPLENGLTRGEQMELARIALASLDAEPVAYNQVQRDMMKDIIVRKMGGNLAGEKLVMDDIHAVTMALIDAGFRAFPPAPIVPETLPCSVELKPGLIIGKGCKTETLLTALKRRADYCAELEAMTPEQRAEHDVGIAEFIKSFGNSEQLNSPVTPDDWVMVPKEPTQAMINAWLSEVADWRGHVAGYKAMLAAVPEKETRPCTK